MGVSYKVGKSLKNIHKVPNKLKNMKRVWSEIGMLELSQTKLRFIKEVEPGDINSTQGKKWEDPITLRREVGGSSFSREQAWAYVVKSNYHAVPKGWRWWKRPDKILRDTSVLFNSLSTRYTDTYTIVGTNVSYAKKHQEGIGVKPRPFLGINLKTVQNVNYVFSKYLRGILK